MICPLSFCAGTMHAHGPFPPLSLCFPLISLHISSKMLFQVQIASLFCLKSTHSSLSPTRKSTAFVALRARPF